jgi:hypothetical protein
MPFLTPFWTLFLLLSFSSYFPSLPKNGHVMLFSHHHMHDAPLCSHIKDLIAHKDSTGGPGPSLPLGPTAHGSGGGGRGLLWVRGCIQEHCFCCRCMCVCVVCTCIITPSLYNVNFWSGPNCSIFDKMDRKKRLYLDLADQFESFDLFPDRWTLALADRRKLVCVLGAILGCFPDLFTESTIDHFDSLILVVLCEYCSFAVPGDKHCFPVVEPSNENFN